ncbi:MAG: hypothetical protein H6814_11245 [Phycisphaeraceae bacterium]|nr:hypothetical protein [Phycisphaeraceae bacterium]
MPGTPDTTGPNSRSYTAPTPFVDGPITDLAVFCSDARFGAQCEEFVTQLLGHSRFDRLVAPGGPACMLDWTADIDEDIETIERLKWFLIENHEIDRVVLIAHEGCAYYTIKLGVDLGALRWRQEDDLRLVVDRIRDVKPGLRVEAYFAGVGGDHIDFRPVVV